MELASYLPSSSTHNRLLCSHCRGTVTPHTKNLSGSNLLSLYKFPLQFSLYKFQKWFSIFKGVLNHEKLTLKSILVFKVLQDVISR